MIAFVVTVLFALVAIVDEGLSLKDVDRRWLRHVKKLQKKGGGEPTRTTSWERRSTLAGALRITAWVVLAGFSTRFIR
jgi:hypothetical protein